LFFQDRYYLVALFGGAGREGRPLFDLLAAAVRAQNLAFFVVHERQNLVEEFLAFLAEEFVVGHTGLHNFRRQNNSRPRAGWVQSGIRSRILRGSVSDFGVEGKMRWRALFGI
jgi:hypothetical protein